MEKRLVYYGKTSVTSWKNAKNDLKTSWQTHGKALVAVWKNACRIMKKRLSQYEKTLGAVWNSERCE
ncbi:MAG: hypothetical protein HXO15_09645 [Prevotella salivae]|nr:hypothetical protein [Segatella salivae]